MAAFGFSISGGVSNFTAVLAEAGSALTPGDSIGADGLRSAGVVEGFGTGDGRGFISGLGAGFGLGFTFACGVVTGSTPIIRMVCGFGVLAGEADFRCTGLVAGVGRLAGVITGRSETFALFKSSRGGRGDRVGSGVWASLAAKLSESPTAGVGPSETVRGLDSDRSIAFFICSI